MFKRPRAEAPAKEVEKLGGILAPVPVFPWSNLAMSYLGVPIVVPEYFVVVQNNHYELCIQKLVDAGFSVLAPNREVNPILSTSTASSSQANANIRSGYAFRDKSTTTLTHSDNQIPVVLAPNSFACLPIPSSGIITSLGGSEYNTYSNLHFPLEKALIESFVRCILLEDSPTYSRWARSLRTAISQMMNYLDVNSGILDTCEDREAVEWFSRNYGRDREAQKGLWDLRISKRIGSENEPPIDSRGHNLKTDQLGSLNSDRKPLR